MLCGLLGGGCFFAGYLLGWWLVCIWCVLLVGRMLCISGFVGTLHENDSEGLV